jgi:hypothetical protein
MRVQGDRTIVRNVDEPLNKKSKSPMIQARIQLRGAYGGYVPLKVLRGKALA